MELTLPLFSGKKVAQVSAGDRFTVATTSNNEVYSWGYRNHGRLGDGTETDHLGNRLLSFHIVLV